MSTNAIVETIDEFPLDGIKKIITDMRLFAENLDVTNEDGFKKITSLYAEAKKWEKIIDAKRLEQNAPDQTRINARNDQAKEVTAPLKGIIVVCKQKADEYQRHLERAKREEEDRISKAALIFDDHVPYIAPLEKTQRGDGAIAVAKEETRFRVLDLAKVPRQYLMLDEQKVKLSIKMGVGMIDGLEIYTKKTTQLRTR